MIDDMRIRNFAAGTRRSYIQYVAGFANYFHRGPQDLDLEAVRQYQLYLSQERKRSSQSINCLVSAVQFLFPVTLEMPWKKEDFPRFRVEEKLPVVLAAEGVEALFNHVNGLENRTVLTCYGAGLRISEAVSLKVSDIDSKAPAHPARFPRPTTPFSDHRTVPNTPCHALSQTDNLAIHHSRPTNGPPRRKAKPIKDRPSSCALVHCTVWSDSRRSALSAPGFLAPRN